MNLQWRTLLTGAFEEAGQQAGIEDDVHFSRISICVDESSFSFERFRLRDIVAHTLSQKTVALAGDAHLTNQRIRLSGPGRSHVGALWFAARRAVDRGFTSRFTFQINRNQSAAAAAAATGAPAGSSAASSASAATGSGAASVAESVQVPTSAYVTEADEHKRLLYEFDEGFSFVVQHQDMLALPSVTKQEVNGMHHHSAASQAGHTTLNSSMASHNGSFAHRHILQYEGVPNSLEVRFHVSARVSPFRSPSKSDPSDIKSGVVVADEAFDASKPYNYVSVHYCKPHSSGPPVLLGFVRAEAFAPAATQTELHRVPALSLIGDGKVHLVSVQYRIQPDQTHVLWVHLDEYGHEHNQDNATLHIELKKWPIRLADGR